MTTSESSSGIIRLSASELLASLGVEQALNRYLDLLQEENKVINLVSRETSRDDLMRLALQSLAPMAMEVIPTRLTGPATLLDIGSGGGFPAVPLLLAIPNLSATLFERRQKKARALERIVAALGLTVKVLPEDFDHYKATGRFDLITLRYVSLTQKTLTRLSSVIAPGGAVLYYGIIEPGLALAAWRVCQQRYTLADSEEPQHLTVLSRPS